MRAERKPSELASVAGSQPKSEPQPNCVAEGQPQSEAQPRKAIGVSVLSIGVKKTGRGQHASARPLIGFDCPIDTVSVAIRSPTNGTPLRKDAGRFR